MWLSDRSLRGVVADELLCHETSLLGVNMLVKFCGGVF